MLGQTAEVAAGFTHENDDIAALLARADRLRAERRQRLMSRAGTGGGVAALVAAGAAASEPGQAETVLADADGRADFGAPATPEELLALANICEAADWYEDIDAHARHGVEGPHSPLAGHQAFASRFASPYGGIGAGAHHSHGAEHMGGAHAAHGDSGSASLAGRGGVLAAGRSGDHAGEHAGDPGALQSAAGHSGAMKHDSAATAVAHDGYSVAAAGSSPHRDHAAGPDALHQAHAGRGAAPSLTEAGAHAGHEAAPPETASHHAEAGVAGADDEGAPASADEALAAILDAEDAPPESPIDPYTDHHDHAAMMGPPPESIVAQIDL